MASIHWLSLHHEVVTQILLASRAKIDPVTTPTVLRTLQRKDYITRQEHTTDTRAKRIDLTPKGQKITKQAVKTVESFDKIYQDKKLYCNLQNCYDNYFIKDDLYMSFGTGS